MNNNSVAFMAFAAGKATEEEAVIKRYIGIGAVNILAVNPSKSELEKLYNTTLEKDPEYITKQEVGEGVDKHIVDTVRIDFIVKTDPNSECCKGIEMVTKIPFFLRKEYRYNRDKTKVQVIDKYGRTAWVTVEQAKAKEIPVYANGPANLDKDYRPAFVGEEDLTNFIKLYLGIPSVMKYNKETGSWYLRENPEESEGRLSNIIDYFKGNFKEIKEVIALQPTNRIKCMFGVRSTDSGSQYQTVYTQMFLPNRTTDYSKLDQDLAERKANGAYSTSEFSVCNLKEYTVEPTEFTNSSSSMPNAIAENPFDL